MGRANVSQQKCLIQSASCCERIKSNELYVFSVDVNFFCTLEFAAHPLSKGKARTLPTFLSNNEPVKRIISIGSCNLFDHTGLDRLLGLVPLTKIQCEPFLLAATFYFIIFIFIYTFPIGPRIRWKNMVQTW
jgi:hypothetical protein